MRAAKIRQYKYGITEDEYTAMLEAQEGRCAICNLERKLVIDHDHKTGKVRGLLCKPCNAMLGPFEQVDIRRVEQYLHRTAEPSGVYG